jgi:predicted patatin/cPLA2 family phospholipase
MDGGIVSPIPLQPALDDDYDKIYVLCVRSEEEIQEEGELGWLERILRPFVTRLQRTLMDRRVERARIHRALSDGTYEIGGKEILLFRPSKSLPVGRLTADRSRIQDAIDIGLQDGHDRL